MTIINYISVIIFYIKNLLSYSYKKPVLISIEGNIGTGKSTFITVISHLLKNKCDIIYEPVELWKTITNDDENPKNILHLFYDNKQKYAFTFQMIAGLTIIQNMLKMLKTTKNKYIFLDRSFLTTKYTFEKMLFDEGLISKIEHTAYNLLCNYYEDTIYNNYKHKHIYLKCDPIISLERIKKRNRIEESNITLEYLIELNKYHDEWLLNNKDVLVIDCNKDTLNDIEWYKNILDKII